MAPGSVGGVAAAVVVFLPLDAATPLAVAAARRLAGVAPTAAGTAETAALVVALPADGLALVVLPTPSEGYWTGRFLSVERLLELVAFFFLAARRLKRCRIVLEYAGGCVVLVLERSMT